MQPLLRISYMLLPLVLSKIAQLTGPLCCESADLLPDNPYDTLATGCDWARNSAGRHIDFASFHLWPDNWLKVCR